MSKVVRALKIQREVQCGQTKMVIAMGLVLCIHQYRKSSEELAEELSQSGLHVLGLFQELGLRETLVQKRLEMLSQLHFLKSHPAQK